MSITDRMSARNTAENWMLELLRAAKGEKAIHTAEKIVALSEPIFYQIAHEHAAEAVKMNLLLADPEKFRERQISYIAKNATLLTGLEVYESYADPKGHLRKLAEMIVETCAEHSSNIGEIEEITGETVYAFSQEVCDIMRERHVTEIDETFAGDAVGVLIREAVGFPGEWTVAMSVNDPDILLNAAFALRTLGVQVAPSAVRALNDGKDPDNDGPSL